MDQLAGALGSIVPAGADDFTGQFINVDFINQSKMQQDKVDRVIAALNWAAPFFCAAWDFAGMLITQQFDQRVDRPTILIVDSLALGLLEPNLYGYHRLLSAFVDYGRAGDAAACEVASHELWEMCCNPSSKLGKPEVADPVHGSTRKAPNGEPVADCVTPPWYPGRKPTVYDGSGRPLYSLWGAVSGPGQFTPGADGTGYFG